MFAERKERGFENGGSGGVFEILRVAQDDKLWMADRGRA